MNILIIDDELSAIEAVKKGIDWEKLSVECLYTAGSMKEAKEKLNRHVIDIMLCDIEMPMGSGLELLQWVNANKPDIICIFMTCHADFSYAQQAIQLGGLDYLLKPLSYEKVEEAILRAIAKLNSEKILMKNSTAWMRNRAIVIDRFWRDFFVGEIAPAREDILRYTRLKGIDIDMDSNYIPLLVGVKKFSESFNKDDLGLIKFSIQNISAELLPIEEVKKDIVPLQDNSVLVIFKSDELAEDEILPLIKDYCEHLIGLVKQYFHVTVCCYIGALDSILTVPGQIENLQIVDFNNVTIQKDIYLLKAYRDYHYLYSDICFPAWSDEVEKGNYDILLKEAEEMLASKENIEKIGRKYLDRFLQDWFYYILLVFAKKHNIFLNELFGDMESDKLSKEAVTSIEALLHWIRYTISKMRDYTDTNKSISNPIDKTVSYIEARLSEDISMEELAKNVHLSADYLTRIFKKAKNISINNYVIVRKMERAKKLLLESNKSIGEIALEVGYMNYSSFYRTFIKTVTMSPQEYKNTYKN